MAEPTLGEIINYRADPGTSGIAPQPVYDDRDMVAQLNQSAQFRAREDREKYNTFLGNLKDTYKDINEIAKQPVMEQDLPELRSDMGNILKEIGNDPSALFGGGAKYNEIQGKIAQLNSKTMQSKGDSLFDIANRAAIDRNPSWNTDKNSSLISSYPNQKLGTRQHYQLVMPGSLDMDALAKTINDTIKQEDTTPGITADKKFLTSTKTISYDPQRYTKLASDFYEGFDANHIPYRKTFQEMVDQSPVLQAQIKSQYKNSKDPYKDFFVDQMKNKIAQGSTDEKQTYNQAYGADLRYKEGMARIWKDENEDTVGAASVVGDMSDAINNGTPKTIENYHGKEGYSKTILEIADPNLLKEFGTIDKESGVVKTPDVIDFDKDNNQLSLVYYERRQTKSGKNIIEKEVPLNPTQWMGQIVRRKFPNKDIGGVNERLEKAYNENGRNLSTLVDRFSGKTTQQPKQMTPKTTTKGLPVFNQ